RSPLPPPRPREPFRRSRLRELSSTCPVHGEARPCPAPSGRHASDRRPGAASLPPSRRTLRILLSAEVEPLPAACKTAARLLSAPFRYSFLTSSFSPRLPPLLRSSEEPWCFRQKLMSLVAGRSSLASPSERLPTNDGRRILSHHFNPHRPRRAAHALDGGIDGSGVQIRHLLFGNVLDLLQGHLANLIFVGRARSLGYASRAFKQDRRGRRLGNKRERAVAVHRDHDRNNQPFEFFLPGAGIELLAELHDVDLRLTQRRSHRRRRRRLARRNLQ